MTGHDPPQRSPCHHARHPDRRPRTDAARHRARRRHHAAVHRCQRVPGVEGRADLRDFDPRGRDLDGGAPTAAGQQHAREQHRADDRVGGGHARRDRVRAARARHDRLVERLPVLDDQRDHRDRRHPGRNVLGPLAPRARGRGRPALPRGPRRGRGIAGGIEHAGRCQGERGGAARARARLGGLGAVRDPHADSSPPPRPRPGSASARARRASRAGCRSRCSASGTSSACRWAWHRRSGSSPAGSSCCRS